MLKRSWLALLLALVIGVVFCVGISRALVLRYASGEVYPPYSTLRADPLGAKGVYEALAALPGAEVRRNFRPLKKLQPSRPVTLVYLAVAHQSLWSEDEFEEFQRLVKGGARAVFLFAPFEESSSASKAAQKQKAATPTPAPKKKSSVKKKGGKKNPEPDKGDDEEADDSGVVSFQKVAEKLGFAFADQAADEKLAFHRRAFLFEPGGSLEREISWHSALYFDELKPEWKPLYLSETKPVIVERQLGAGSIVMASDSYFASNEALRKERTPRLLARVFGGPPLVIFDEEHLGVSDTTGVADLARKYRLQGLLATLVVIALLFLWKNMLRFVPPYEDASAAEVVMGKESAQGLENLLQRSVPPQELLRVCVEEWRRTGAHSADELARIETGLAAELARPKRERRLVDGYRALCAALQRLR